MVAVCVATVSEVVQLVDVNLFAAVTAASTKPAVATAVVVAPVGGALVSATGVSVKLPVPTAEIFTAEPPDEVDSLIVCEPEYVPLMVVDATVCDALRLYVPVPPVPVPKEVTVVDVVTPVPEITVPTPIDPACTLLIVRTVPLMLPVPEKKLVALVLTV
jgi:hypothetical protein